MHIQLADGVADEVDYGSPRPGPALTPLGREPVLMVSPDDRSLVTLLAPPGASGALATANLRVVVLDVEAGRQEQLQTPGLKVGASGIDCGPDGVFVIAQQATAAGANGQIWLACRTRLEHHGGSPETSMTTLASA